MATEQLLDFDLNSSTTRELQFDMIYNMMTENTFAEKDLITLFQKIIEFDFNLLGESEYNSLVRSIGTIYSGHLPLVKPLIANFYRDWKNFTQIMLTIEYINEIDNKDDIETYNYVNKHILSQIVEICKSTSENKPFQISNIALSTSNMILLIARVLPIIEPNQNIVKDLLSIYNNYPVSLQTSIIPYVASVNSVKLLPKEMISNFIRDRKTHGQIFQAVLSDLPDEIFERESELIAHAARAEKELLPILADHAPAFKKYKDILADIIRYVDKEFYFQTWYNLAACEQKFPTSILKKRNIPEQFALILAERPQDFMNMDRAITFLRFASEDYFYNFYHSFEFTPENADFFNQPALLHRLSESYDKKYKLKPVENKENCLINIDLLVTMIIKNNSTNIEFFNHFVSSKCTMLIDFIKYYSDYEHEIEGTLESVAYAITSKQLNYLFTSDLYNEYYYLMLEMLLYRKTSSTPFDDKFIQLRIPEIMTPDMSLFTDMQSFFNEALNNNYYIKNIREYSPTIREFYYCGQFINISFEGHLEWRYSNLAPTNFMIVAAMSCIYCDQTEKLKENPLTFASIQPMSYVLIIPLPFYKLALKVVYETFNQRCIRILDKQITIFFILIFITSMIIDNFNLIPPEVIVFIIKELEVFTIQGSNPLLTEYKNLINQMLQKNGKKILKQIASNVKLLEPYSVYESLDINVFPTQHVLWLLVEMQNRPHEYEHFRSRIISRAYQKNSTDINLIYTADAQKDYRAVYNMVNQIGYYNRRMHFNEFLKNKRLSYVSLLLVANNKIAPSGDLLLTVAGVKRLSRAIASVMTMSNEYNMNLAQLVQNVISRASSGNKYTNYAFYKRFLEIPFLSCPYSVVEPLYGSSPCQGIYIKTIQSCFIRVTDQVLMKKDWRNFPKATDLSIFFVEYLFKTIVSIPGQIAMGALVSLVGQNTWSFPLFKTPPFEILKMILKRAEELNNVEEDKNLGYDAFQTLSVINVILFTPEMRQVFFLEIVPHIAEYSIAQRIFICFIIAHHLIDSRTQIFTYTAITPYVNEIAKCSVIPKKDMSVIEQKLLVVGTLLMATISQIHQNLDPFAKSLSAEFLKHENFFVNFSHTDGTCTSFVGNFTHDVLHFVFRIGQIPMSQFSVMPRSKSIPTSENKGEILPIAKSDKTLEGPLKHLPLTVQIRILNKKLPPKPQKINTRQFIELYKYGLFTVRYFCSSRCNLILPQYIQPIIEATEAIKKYEDVPDPEPIKFDFSYLVSVIPDLLSMWKQNSMIDDFTMTIVVSLLEIHGEKIIEEIIKSRDTALIAFCSIVKSVGKIPLNLIEKFDKLITPVLTMRCFVEGNTKLGYSVISMALTVKIPPKPYVIELTKKYLQSDDKRVWYRGLKLIPLYPKEMQHDLINVCFTNVTDLVSSTLFLMVLPEEGPKRPAMFISILSDLLEKKKEDEAISIITDSLTSPYTGKEQLSELMEKDEKTWTLIYNNIEWIWNKHNEKNSFKFITRFMHILPFQIRVGEMRKAIKAMIYKESIALLIIQSNALFENSLKVILSYLNDEQSIHSQIYIKFPEMMSPESGGVLRGWFTSFAEEMVKPERGLFIPSINNCSYTINPSCTDYSKFEGIGRFIGIVVLHGEILGYQLAHHLIKAMIGRNVNASDLADYSPVVYDTITWIQDTKNDPADLCLDFTVDSGNDSPGIELCEGGRDKMLTRENADEYVELLTQYYLYKETDKQIDALKKGFQFVLKPSLFTLFTSSEIGSIICGEQKTDVEELIKNFEILPPLSQEHPIVQMFFKIIRRWNNELISRLLLFMTSAHTIPIGGYEFMKAQGRQPKLKLAPMTGDKLPLPSALTCFSHLALPPYQTEEEMEKGLIMAITESEGFK
ncbi:hypothetical protein TVAG_035450 [Trichomonas vaginalis G3]|uniref:HECT-type E3 ubiquitin transferase n=1 Tax=Trichomonas vaginalis (strain ATCC PRA-98 / G3) TaxID=412133 RepID=A2DAL9_TRIV3|nr:ubiquitin protein ligase protein [Trichomonas vaginalis G3]EAY22522.1 hypothetical protein TVAG_035450 [Trichomonas vaginalis G3]KAI5497255.1 ubiquitin protein ligase protein [Trichomonas vaginalis G3]|eukprot:XP_001583508.1 hypothetical protein [Trichomonas vaginalis G3]